MTKSQPKRETSDLAIFMANQVRARRKKAGVTQAELASRAGVTVETVARIERVLRDRPSANANPSLETLERLASSLGCHAADLVDGRRGEKTHGDPLIAMIRVAKPATRRTMATVLEALLRQEKRERKVG